MLSLKCKLKKILKFNKIFIYGFLIFSIFGSHNLSFGADYSLLPSLSITGVYDDNVLFDRTALIDDYIAIFSPELKYNYNTERLSLDLSALLDIQEYYEETQLNTVDQRYALDTKYQALERLDLSGYLSYIKDTTFDSFLEETGRVTFLEDRERSDAGGGFTYQVTEKSDITPKYEYTNVNHEETGSVDYFRNKLSFSYNYKLKNQRDIFTLQPSYYRYNALGNQRESTRVEKSDNYTLSIGWQHPFSETFQWKIFLGARYSELEFNIKNDDDNWGGVADIFFLKLSEGKSSYLIGFKSSLETGIEGDQFQVNKFYCKLKKMFFKRLGVRFDGTLIYSKEIAVDDETENEEDSRYYLLKPSLFYQLTENHSLNLYYSFQKDYDRARTKKNQTRERNRVWLSLDFNFPINW